MSYPHRVERIIPQHVRHGLDNGTYKEFGGVIRDTVNGRIVTHLQFGDLLKINADVLSQLASLQKASVALEAVNLIVNVVGFAIVCQKLNQVSLKVDEVSEQVGKILERQQFAETLKNIEIRSNLEAYLENIERGLHDDDFNGVSHATNDLNAIIKYHMRVSDHLIKNTETVYQNMFLIEEYIDMSVIGNIAIARSYAHQGRFKTGIDVLTKLEVWHENFLNSLEQPIRDKPLWLRKLTAQQRQDCKRVIGKQRAVSNSLIFERERYNLCIKLDESLEWLVDHVKDKPITVFVFDEL